MALTSLIATPGHVVAKRLAADYRLDPDVHARIIREVDRVVMAEREACAKIAEGELMEVYASGEERIVRSIVEQIRARSTLKE